MSNENRFITDKYQGGRVSTQVQNLEREIAIFFSTYPYALKFTERLLKLRNAYINKFSYTLNADGIKEYFLEINYHRFNYQEILPDIYKLVDDEEEFNDMFFDVIKLEFFISTKDSTELESVSLEFIHRNGIDPDVWRESTGYKFRQTELVHMWSESNLSRLNHHVNIALYRYEDGGLKNVLVALNEYFRNNVLHKKVLQVTSLEATDGNPLPL